jgi:membrane protease subunit HflK
MSEEGRWRPELIAGVGQRVSERIGESLRRRAKWLVIGAIAILTALTTYYQVEPDEVGIVTRFGQFVRTAEPGPHFKLPFWIERVAKVPVERQLKQEFGFRTVSADVQTEYEHTEDTQAEAMMLTGDLNVATVEWIVQYKVRDPYLYLFKVRDVTSTFRDLSEASMRQVVGDRSVSEVLTIGREEIQLRAKEDLQGMCDRYETGIEVLQLVLQDVNPPEPVRPSFNEVNQAIQERERAINEAWAAYNRVIPEARGKALQTVESAEGYATERINRAQGDANRFLAVQAEYAKAPEVTRTRLYLETMARVLPGAGPRIVVDSDVKGVLPMLSLDQAGTPRPAKEPAPKTGATRGTP